MSGKCQGAEEFLSKLRQNTPTSKRSESGSILPHIFD